MLENDIVYIDDNGVQQIATVDDDMTDADITAATNDPDWDWALPE